MLKETPNMTCGSARKLDPWVVRNGSVVNIRNFYKTIIKQKKYNPTKTTSEKKTTTQIKQRTSTIQAQTKSNKALTKIY